MILTSEASLPSAAPLISILLLVNYAIHSWSKNDFNHLFDHLIRHELLVDWKK